MPLSKHLLLSVPDDWSNDRRGTFFEEFVADLLRPMRLKVDKRLRVTGMEIDLLARGEDQPRTILVECKAHRDPLPADVISKILGNVTIRNADAGWLFSTSDLGKDGRGQWDEIQADERLARKFTWYPPEKIIEILISQRLIIDPQALLYHFDSNKTGDWTLVVSPVCRAWLVEIIEDGLPTRYSVFDAHNSNIFDQSKAEEVAKLSPRFSSLIFFSVQQPSVTTTAREIPRATVAPVIPGDTWDDLRPSRPTDFVGRDDVISQISEFITQVRSLQTLTRTFAIQGPSGWGKSSLVLKVADLALRGKVPSCSLTAIDTRSATNSAFVTEALRVAFLDAAKRNIIPTDSEYRVESLNHPLDSKDILYALDKLQGSGHVIVLIFDQFEELFAKEELFETFNAVRELSLDIDAKQAPLVLGFAWKTDISLPQLHPAYHLWHQLSDRRRTFKVREFGQSDILKIISKAEKSTGHKLTSAVRSRLVEQCQGFPWLLKKLLVHVLRRISASESQYLLLERELDIESLFKEDLSSLSEEQIRCLKYVAAKAPVAVSEVEENFSRESTGILLASRLLVRSGMNYVIYWDIFRDYLVDERVPYIPWARTFQVAPVQAITALRKLADVQPLSASTLAETLSIKEGPCLNILSDLDALQLVDRLPGDLYQAARHLTDLSESSIANYVQGQLKRHVVVRKIDETFDRSTALNMADWDRFFEEAHPRTADYSKKTIHTYAANFRRWLLFAGILEEEDKTLLKPSGMGKQMGVLVAKKGERGNRVFLGATSPDNLMLLIQKLLGSVEGIGRSVLLDQGFRNALTDASALGLIVRVEEDRIKLKEQIVSEGELVAKVKDIVRKQKGIQIIERAITDGVKNSEELRERVRTSIAPRWKPASAIRNTNGLKRYYEWCAE